VARAVRANPPSLILPSFYLSRVKKQTQRAVTLVLFAASRGEAAGSGVHRYAEAGERGSFICSGTPSHDGLAPGHISNC